MPALDLKAEFQIFSHYLVGARAPDDLSVRYERAHQMRMPAEDSKFDQAMIRFALRWPTGLRCLDAYHALFHRRGLLRKKLLLALTVLEASPFQADQWEWPGSSRLKWIANFIWIGTVFTLEAIAGGLLAGAVFVTRGRR